MRFSRFAHGLAGCMLVAIGASMSAGAQGVDSAASVTYARDIAPILARNCVRCHRQGGDAPFALTTFAEARRRASLMAAATRTRLMPPWKPADPPGFFAGDRRLTELDINVFATWAAAGAPEGPAAASRVTPEPPEWELGTPDLVVSMTEPYRLAADAPDTIRSFVIPVPIDRPRYVGGIEFQSLSTGAVHHANIKMDVEGSSRRVDADDREPGFEGSGRDARFPDGQFLGWTPGQSPHVSAGETWLLPAGADLIVELHMTPTGKPESVQVRIGLQFTDAPPARMPYMIRLGNQRLDIPAGAERFISTDEYELPVDVDLLAVQPHAHRVARAVTGTAYLPDGRLTTLIDIPDWDFRWQDVYRYRTPVHLPRGTRLLMRFEYDNSDSNPRNPHRPARRVTFGQTSDDEMGDLWFQVATSTSAERGALAAEVDIKMLREDTAGDEMLVAASPGDARARRDLAYCYEALGRPTDARAQLERAIALAPDSADGHYQLGTLLLKQHRPDEAFVSLSRAAALKPEWSETHNNLGVIRLLQANPAAAAVLFDEAVRLDPRNAEAQFNRGRVLAATGRAADALAAFSESLRLRRDDADALAAAGSASAALGRAEDAVRLLREAITVQPRHAAALVDLAWLLATSAPRNQRRAAEAVQFAERAVTIAGDSPAVLDTLAAAYFAAGQVNEAAETARRAVRMAVDRGDDAQARGEIEARLRVYEATARLGGPGPD